MFKVAFTELECVTETSDTSDSDEVYTVIFVGDATTAPPRTRVFRSNLLTDVDTGNVRKQWIPVWGVNGAPTDIPDPNHILILCGLMEADASDPYTVHSAAVSAASAFALSIARRDNHAAMASRVGNVMLTGMKKRAFLPHAIPSSPDDVINVDEVRFGQSDLDAARGGRLVTKSVELKAQSGFYRALFHMRFGPDA